ncbi:hypothetical protein BH10PAT1_BH10PAT1_3140 [soil metagenome]
MLSKQDKTDITVILKGQLDPIKTDINQLKTDVNILKTDVSQLKTGVNQLQKDLKKVKKDTGYMVGVLDREILTDRKRIKKLEESANLSLT